MKKLFVLFVIGTVCFCCQSVKAQIGSDYMYLELTDLAHKKALVAGDRADNNIYHQKPEKIDMINAQSLQRLQR